MFPGKPRVWVDIVFTLFFSTNILPALYETPYEKSLDVVDVQYACI